MDDDLFEDEDMKLIEETIAYRLKKLDKHLARYPGDVAATTKISQLEKLKKKIRQDAESA